MLLMSDSLKDRIDLSEIEKSQKTDEILCQICTLNKTTITGKLLEIKTLRSGEIDEVIIEVMADDVCSALHNFPVVNLTLISPLYKKHLLAHRNDGYDVIFKKNELNYVMIIRS